MVIIILWILSQAECCHSSIKQKYTSHPLFSSTYNMITIHLSTATSLISQLRLNDYKGLQCHYTAQPLKTNLHQYCGFGFGFWIVEETYWPNESSSLEDLFF